MKNYIEEKILEFDYFTSFFGEMHQNLKANNANPTQNIKSLKRREYIQIYFMRTALP